MTWLLPYDLHVLSMSGRQAHACLTQVSLDYSSEADMVGTMRLGVALQPVVVALFANSPFRRGQPSGMLSWRAHTWMQVEDPRHATHRIHCRDRKTLHSNDAVPSSLCETLRALTWYLADGQGSAWHTLSCVSS